jgi:hypothetical protein
MRPRLGLISTLIVLMFAEWDEPTRGQDETQNISQQCQSLCKIPDATWRSIPWELDLLKAQRMAVEQSKPIFIWAMDGHPLACT